MLGIRNEHLVNVTSKRIQCDEIWSLCYAKEKNLSPDKQGKIDNGDVWTWTAIDAETKLVPFWLVGLRDTGYATEFINGLRSRLANRVKLTTDGHKAYLVSVEDDFGSDVDYGMIAKLQGEEPAVEKRHRPAVCISAEKRPFRGNPDPTQVLMSYAERQSLTMRMSMRRFTKLANGFIRKIENLEHAVALQFMHCNFTRPHKSLD